MARPASKGFDYFPLDVGFGRDLKIRKIQKACGVATQAVLIDLLSVIYRDEGYFMNWDDDVQFLIADDFDIEESKIEMIIEKAIETGFFNKEKFDEFHILTSKAIQIRFKEMSKHRRKSGISSQFDLIKSTETKDEESHNLNETPSNSDVGGVIVNETTVNDNETPDKSSESTQSKSKVNKSKVNKTNNNNVVGMEPPTPDLKSITLWEQLWGFPNAIAQQDLGEWIKKFGDEMVTWAIRYAGTRDVKAKAADRYLDTVFRGWEKQNIKTIEQAEQQSEQHRQQMSSEYGGRHQSKGQVRESTPDWAQDGYQHEHKPVDQDTVDEVKAQVARLKQEQAQEA